MRTSLVSVVCASMIAACAPVPPPSAPSLTSTAGPQPPPADALRPPLVVIGAPNHATAGGESIVFDGVAEGLAWPALARAYAAKSKAGERVVLAAPRNARVLDVLRAVWTLRATDVEVQTLGPGNEVRPLVLAKRPAARADGPPTCHAAVFVSPEGKLRVALPSGSVSVKDVAELAASIAHGARTCDVRWLAFGGETNDMAWGWVFDVASAIDASNAAPRARFVLGEALHER